MSVERLRSVGGPGAGVVVDPVTMLHPRAGEIAPADGADATFADGAVYHAWGWPVTQHNDRTQLDLDGEVSAVAIPLSLSAEVIQILTARHCGPAVLAHPGAPEHQIVLTGERFGAPLPWPSGVYQVAGPLMLPPTMTIDGPVTWVQPPSKESLQLCREIDVLGALRSVVAG